MSESKGFIFFDKDTDFMGVIDAGQVVLEGTVVGDVSATETVYLKHGSHIKGDINTKKILAEEGAIHFGSLFLGSEKRMPSVPSGSTGTERVSAEESVSESDPGTQSSDPEKQPPHKGSVKGSSNSSRLW